MPLYYRAPETFIHLNYRPFETMEELDLYGFENRSDNEVNNYSHEIIQTDNNLYQNTEH